MFAEMNYFYRIISRVAIQSIGQLVEACRLSDLLVGLSDG